MPQDGSAPEGYEHKSSDPERLERKREQRLQREQRQQERRREQHLARRNTVAVLFVIVAVVAIAGWFGYHRFVAGSQKGLASTEVAQSVAHAGPVDPASSSDTSSTDMQLASTPMTPEAAATPIIASYKDVVLRLPVATDDLTELAMHQASYSYALHMVTPLKAAVLEDVRKAHGTERPAKQPHGKDAVLDGSILELWRRGRRGKPDTALDVGAHPGDTLLSPVDGTVVLVKKYKLYEKWNDFEVHIQPTGHPELDVVMIHMTDPSVAAGDTVQAGITKIGSLRKLSDKCYLQLKSYTAKGDGGNHTHIQINNAKDKLYLKGKHLKGAITVTEQPVTNQSTAK